MEFDFDPDLEHFRWEIREFIQANLPKDIVRRQRFHSFPSDDTDIRVWMKTLHKKGWSVPHWPAEYGGTGWTPLQIYVFEEELARADAPMFPWGGTQMLGPVLYTFGTEEQKVRFLPGIRDGSVNWAQGYSEPGSGSDLASLRTRAERDGEHYVVNGQKIWTSGAYHSEWGFFLVKTDTSGKPQRSISFLLIDLSTPGVTVRRIPEIAGGSHLCEVFLEDVRVPVENRIGDEGAGWGYGKFLLDNERTASSFIFWNKRELAKLKALARRETIDGVPVIETPLFAQRLAKVEAQVIALEWSVLRVLTEEKTRWDPTAIASCLKVRGSQLQQRITELQMLAMGSKGLRLIERGDYDGVVGGDVWHEDLAGKTNVALICRAATIYGGTLQIQRNIIAKLALGC